MARLCLSAYLPQRQELLGRKIRNALFLNQRGEALTRQGAWLVIHERAARLGIENFGPRALRHGFARQLLDKGASIPEVQAALSHKRRETTKQLYAGKRRT